MGCGGSKESAPPAAAATPLPSSMGRREHGSFVAQQPKEFIKFASGNGTASMKMPQKRKPSTGKKRRGSAPMLIHEASPGSGRKPSMGSGRKKSVFIVWGGCSLHT